MLRSAGILPFRRSGGRLMVLLAHPGGPFWQRRDLGAWTIPKGLIAQGESAEAAARREFAEELGVAAEGMLIPLGAVKQRGGKQVEAFALETDFDPDDLRSNTFELEWPPRSGRMQSFAEIDRVAWMYPEEALENIVGGQRPLLYRLNGLLGISSLK